MAVDECIFVFNNLLIFLREASTTTKVSSETDAAATGWDRRSKLNK